MTDIQRVVARHLAAKEGTETILEREAAYFHTNNGGLTLTLLEVVGQKGSRFKFRYTFGSMGGQATGEFDLPAVAAAWINAALYKIGPEILEKEGGQWNPYDYPDLYVNGERVDPGPTLESEAASFSFVPRTGHVKTAATLRLASWADSLAKTATVFPSEKALKDYLHDHPNADKAKHSVGKKEDQDHGEDSHKEEHGHEEEDIPAAILPFKEKLKAIYRKAEKDLAHHVEHHTEKLKEEHGDDWPAGVPRPWKQRWDGFSTKLEKAGKEVKAWVKKESDTNPDLGKFLKDDSYRRKSLQEMHRKLTDAPDKFVDAALEIAAEEVAEFKEAGKGIKAAMSGKPVSDLQKHAIKKAAFHVGLSVAVGSVGALAAGAAGTGALAAASGKTFAVSLARTIAYKAVAKSMGALNTLQEVEHLGVGVGALFKSWLTKVAAKKDPKEKPASPDDMLGALVASKVAQVIADLDGEDLLEAVKESAAEGPAKKDSPKKKADLNVVASGWLNVIHARKVSLRWDKTRWDLEFMPSGEDLPRSQSYGQAAPSERWQMPTLVKALAASPWGYITRDGATPSTLSFQAIVQSIGLTDADTGESAMAKVIAAYDKCLAHTKKVFSDPSFVEMPPPATVLEKVLSVASSTVKPKLRWKKVSS